MVIKTGDSKINTWVWIVISVVLVVLVIIAIIPQDFWVELSMKLFK